MLIHTVTITGKWWDELTYTVILPHGNNKVQHSYLIKQFKCLIMFTKWTWYAAVSTMSMKALLVNTVPVLCQIMQKKAKSRARVATFLVFDITAGRPMASNKRNLIMWSMAKLLVEHTPWICNHLQTLTLYFVHFLLCLVAAYQIDPTKVLPDSGIFGLKIGRSCKNRDWWQPYSQPLVQIWRSTFILWRKCYVDAQSHWAIIHLNNKPHRWHVSNVAHFEHCMSI